MYDELIKKIRHCATDPMHCLSCGEDKDGRCFKRLMTKAADAIEELQQQVEHYHGCMNDWFEAAQEYKAQIPSWIPATERLPEAEEEVIVCDKMPNGTRYVTTAWIREDCTFWNDCGKMYEVTHWMPLPQPPEELTGTDTRGGIRRDDAGDVIDWGITGPPGDVGKTEEG